MFTLLYQNVHIVLSQYRAQCSQITRNWEEVWFIGPNVSTVIASQGKNQPYSGTCVAENLTHARSHARTNERTHAITQGGKEGGADGRTEGERVRENRKWNGTIFLDIVNLYLVSLFHFLFCMLLAHRVYFLLRRPRCGSFL